MYKMLQEEKEKLLNLISETILLFLLTAREGLSEERYKRLEVLYNEIAKILDKNEQNCNERCREIFRIMMFEFRLNIEFYKRYLRLGKTKEKFINDFFIVILHDVEEFVEQNL